MRWSYRATGLVTLAACIPPEDWSDCEARDPVTVTGVRQVDDTLEIDVGYSGGCEEHSFAICGPRGFHESYPPQADLVLWHDNGGDRCEAAITDTLSFALAPLYEAFDQSLGAPGPLVVHVGSNSALIAVPEPDGRP